MQSGSPGMVDEDEDASYKMSKEMRKAVDDAIGDYAHFGRILTGDTYLACTRTREMFYEQFKADAVEMEGALLHKYVVIGINHLSLLEF